MKKYEHELVELEKKPKVELTDFELEHIFHLKDEICNINNELNIIEENKEEQNYFLNTGHVLFQYYETFENLSTKCTKKQKNSIINFFDKQEYNEEDKVNDTEKNDKEVVKSRAEILDNYLSITEENHSKNYIYQDNTSSICKKCNVERIIDHAEAMYECPVCGITEFIIIDSDKPSYKEPPREVSYFAYKRINHFNEWLAQFQAKESTEIPKDVFDKIWIEIKKERITNMANLTPNKLRDILKKLRLNKYYEHVHHIINRLNGLPAPIMNRETEEKLRSMFKEIQIPFIKHCPKDRKNFLSYSYVLHKFVQLLGYDHYLINFPLLKSREKLHQQDIIWKEICNDLKWEFIRSV